MDLYLASQFVQVNGNAVDLARLDYALNNRPVPEGIVTEFLASQRPDGSWSPFWATGYSSLDATCFHLAQACQLGIGLNDPAMSAALGFIANHQKLDGWWEEEGAITEKAPPWVLPGDQEARLYLTSNCGYWLANSTAHRERAQKAGSFLAAYQDEGGDLPSFLQTHWLACGLWYCMGMAQQAECALAYMDSEMGNFTPNNFSWMITSLRMVNVPAAHPVVELAAETLADLQDTYGFWSSDDGPGFDVHTTLEALFALKLCEKI